MPAIDFFSRFTDAHADLLQAPALNGFSITPSDANELPYVTRGIYIGTGGNCSLVLAGNNSTTPVLLKNIPDGTILPLRVKQIRITLTTCTDIIGLY